ncbi:MAG: glycogen-debranching protein [Myxococcales bacterium]|jgi:glycogen operon protein
MKRSWHTIEGAPHPLGVSYVAAEGAYNFALYSKHAERVTLLVYAAEDVETPLRAIALDPLVHRTGRIWHCRIPCAEIERARFYAYSVDGPRTQCLPDWHTFDPAKVLLDPYAREIHFPPGFDRSAACAPGSNAGKAPLGVLCGRHDSPPATEPVQRPHHEAQLVIYELHVRGFTRHPSSPVEREHRGSYAGVIDMIPYLVDLGVTAVELMPVFQNDPQGGDYWGYSPMSFFAPHIAYATRDSCKDVAREFVRMVDALHDAGIEVLVDAVYNHTAEGDHRGPTYSFKGIDNSTFYLCSGDPQCPYLDYTGTGNTLHCANRHVRRMILDSLRHWTQELHVDGFRFDLASIFARDSKGELAIGDDAAPIFGDIGADPLLAPVRLIAEPWDAVGTFQLGRHFPGVQWHQWNGRFRDDVRRFVRGDSGMVPAMMCRMYGSDDLFPDVPPDVFHPYQSINYVSIHDGLTLRDLVSYEHKHNEENGHDNTDGPAESFSCNYGHEGDEGAAPEIATLRERQARNFMAILFLANGIPMLRAGDELLQSQGGNDNPYNQDNETTWIDWRLRETRGHFHRFVRELIAFRKRHPSLCRSRYWREDVRWFGVDGPVDLSANSRGFAFYLRGSAVDDADLYVVLNMDSRDITAKVQVGSPSEWRRVIDTAVAPPGDIVQESEAPRLAASSTDVGGRSVVVFVRDRHGAP